MEIVKDMLPIKYLVGVWKTLPGYPTSEDVLYEICHYMNRKGMTDFSELTFNGIWYDTTGVANWKGTDVEARLNEMMSDGTFLVNRTDANGKNWYEIKGEIPWLESKRVS